MADQPDKPRPANQQPPLKLHSVLGGNAAWERKIVHIACVGSNAEFRAAVDRLTHRASLSLVRNSTPDVSGSSGGDVDSEDRS